MVSEEECFRTSERNGYYVIHSILPEIRNTDEDDFKSALTREYSSAADNLSVSELKKTAR